MRMRIRIKIHLFKGNMKKNNARFIPLISIFQFMKENKKKKIKIKEINIYIYFLF